MINYYELLRKTSEFIGQLYTFIKNILFYEINIPILDINFVVVDMFLVLSGVGLALWLTITIINYFKE